MNYNRIRIEIMATIDRTAKFGSKKSIKSQFDYDLDRISGPPRSNRIGLDNIIWAIRYDRPPYFVRWRTCTCTLKINSHWVLKHKLLLNSVVGLDWSPSTGLIYSHWLEHLPSLASPTCSQRLIEYNMKVQSVIFQSTCTSS